MPGSLSTLKALCAALALLFVVAQPAAAQLSFKPTAEAVQEDKLLQALKEGDKISGRITIPDTMASSLIQPAGRDWRDFQRSKLPVIGGIAILGMLALLAIFLMVRGRIRPDHGFSGTKILRFASFERFIHWMTASCFIVLALSGLNISFGRVLILPMFGASAFATMSGYAKIAHDFLAFPFMLGVLVMFLIWIKDNIPGKIDWQWLKQGGGILSKGVHPPAKRFNAGQKGIFWIVVIGGALMCGIRLVHAVPLSSGQRHRVAVLDRDPRYHRDAVHRGDAGAHLYRFGRHGRRVRRDGNGRSRSQLGQRTSRALGRRGTGQGPRPGGGLACPAGRIGRPEHKVGGSIMKAFISAVVVAVIVAFVASFVLSGVQMTSDTAFTTSGARVGNPGTNLVGPG